MQKRESNEIGERDEKDGRGEKEMVERRESFQQIIEISIVMVN